MGRFRRRPRVGCPKQIVHPTKYDTVHHCSESEVQHIHPSHTTIMNHHLTKNKHFYPHSTSVQNTYDSVDIYGGSYEVPRPGAVAGAAYPGMGPGAVAGAAYPGMGPGAVAGAAYPGMGPGAVAGAGYPGMGPGAVAGAGYPGMGPGGQVAGAMKPGHYGKCHGKKKWC